MLGEKTNLCCRKLAGSLNFTHFFVPSKSREINVLPVVLLLHRKEGLPSLFFCDINCIAASLCAIWCFCLDEARVSNCYKNLLKIQFLLSIFLKMLIFYCYSGYIF